jgi:hypothetical protein
LNPWPKTGSTGDAFWKPYAPKLVEGNKSYLKDKINELATNSKNKNIRDQCKGINEFKRVHQPQSNLMKDENGELLADSHIVLNRWKNCS